MRGRKLLLRGVFALALPSMLPGQANGASLFCESRLRSPVPLAESVRQIDANFEELEATLESKRCQSDPRIFAACIAAVDAIFQLNREPLTLVPRGALRGTRARVVHKLGMLEAVSTRDLAKDPAAVAAAWDRFYAERSYEGYPVRETLDFARNRYVRPEESPLRAAAAVLASLCELSPESCSLPERWSLKELRKEIARISGDVNFRETDFRLLMHDVIAALSVTSQRKEIKVVASAGDTENFIARVRALVGDDMMDRDTPERDDEVFVTNTDYLPVFRGVGPDGTHVHRGVVRIRNYLIVPKGSRVADLPEDAGRAAGYRYSKIAEGDGVYAKLEFKVGFSERDAETGRYFDVDGVVNKPDIVIERGDLNLLLASPESFAANREQVVARTRAITVNAPAEVDSMIERIGLAHRMNAVDLNPVANIRYMRHARRLRFPNPFAPGTQFEVQVTVDEQVRVKNLDTGQVFSYAPDERVIELKIPTQFSDLSDEKLESLGLSRLAEVRRAYLALPEAPGTVRNQGKGSRSRAFSARPLPLG